MHRLYVTFYNFIMCFTVALSSTCTPHLEMHILYGFCYVMFGRMQFYCCFVSNCFSRRNETTCSRLSYDVADGFGFFLSFIWFAFEYIVHKWTSERHTHIIYAHKHFRMANKKSIECVVRSVGKPSCRWNRIPFSSTLYSVA